MPEHLFAVLAFRADDFLIPWAPLTWPQSTLVNPRMHIAPLRLQLIDIRPQIRDFALQRLDLIRIRPQGLVESLQQEIRRGLMLGRRRTAIVAAVPILQATPRAARAHRRRAVRPTANLLRLIRARVHVPTREVFVEEAGALRSGALLQAGGPRRVAGLLVLGLRRRAELLVVVVGDAVEFAVVARVWLVLAVDV